MLMEELPNLSVGATRWRVLFRERGTPEVSHPGGFQQQAPDVRAHRTLSPSLARSPPRYVGCFRYTLRHPLSRPEFISWRPLRLQLVGTLNPIRYVAAWFRRFGTNTHHSCTALFAIQKQERGHSALNQYYEYNLIISNHSNHGCTHSHHRKSEGRVR